MHESLQCPTPKKWGRCGRKKCRPCMNWRRMQWIYRLKQEALVNERAWFLTLTYSSAPTPEQCRDSWQKFLKRVRKSLTATNAEASKLRIKYFTVVETGKRNGRLHLHSLIFCPATVTRRALENHWPHGFSNCKLVRPTHIQYVSKYISKDTHRIMASQLLGLQVGIPLGSGHPTWYRKMRSTRLKKQGIKHLQAITDTTNTGLDGPMDPIFNNVKTRSPTNSRREFSAKQKSDNGCDHQKEKKIFLNDVCDVAEGTGSSPRRTEGGSADG